VGKHRLDDRFASIRGPCRVRTDAKTRTPIVEAEAAKTQEPMEFEQMLAARFRPAGVFPEQRRVDTDLLCDEGEHRRWR